MKTFEAAAAAYKEASGKALTLSRALITEAINLEDAQLLFKQHKKERDNAISKSRQLRKELIELCPHQHTIQPYPWYVDSGIKQCKDCGIDL